MQNYSNDYEEHFKGFLCFPQVTLKQLEKQTS